MNAGARIGLLGGTLDPIHVGHLDTAVAAWRALNLQRVYVVPSRVPPHRSQQPIASGYHRFAMASLAINGIDGLAASDDELRTPGASYTADTLSRFRERTGLDASQVFFITGADAFAEIETWHRYPEVLDLAQFVVVSRPGFPAESTRQRLPDLAARMKSVPAGSAPNFTGAPIPQGQANRGLTSIFLVDAPTRAVSSTDIRRRLASGETVAGLVADAVARHIAQHGLYSEGVGSSAANHLHGEN